MSCDMDGLLTQVLPSEMLENMENQMAALFGEMNFSYRTFFGMLLEGRIQEGIAYLSECIKGLGVSQISAGKKLLLSVLLMGILGSILQLVSESAIQKQIAQTGQYLLVCIAATILLGICEEGYQICSAFLAKEEQFLQILLPVFCMTLTLESGAVTGYGYYQLTLLILYYMQLVIKCVFFPAIRVYAALVLLNNLGKKKRFEQMQNLCKQVIEWGTKAGMYVGIGSFWLQGSLYPKLDANRRNLLIKGVGMIPGIGDISENASSILIGALQLTKSCLGIAGAAGILLLLIVPILKVGAAGVGMKLIGSLLQMLGEKRISEIADQIGTAKFCFVRLLLCEAGILLISLAVIALCTSHG